MSGTIKTVPNQKVVNINKEKADKQNYYAVINLEAMSKAAVDLDGNCFKLWMYFAKNQNNYSFALSSKDVDENFGIKKKAYDRAMGILQEKGYLVEVSGNQYKFYEIPNFNQSATLYQKDTTALYQNDTTSLYQNDTRNITDNTNNNTIERIVSPSGKNAQSAPRFKSKGQRDEGFIF